MRKTKNETRWTAKKTEKNGQNKININFYTKST